MSAENWRVWRSAGAVAGGGPAAGGGRYTLAGEEYSLDLAGARLAGGSGGSCEAEYHLLSCAVSSRRLPAPDARAAVASANPALGLGLGLGLGLDLFVPRPARIRRFVAAAFSATDLRGVGGRRSGRALL